MTFLEEFRQLLIREPKHFAPRQDDENSEYTSFCYKAKSCYMCFACDYLEDSFYMNHSQHVKDCMDGMGVRESELSYECMDAVNFYNCDYCWNGANNTDCFLCEDVKGCKNCFGCSGLRKGEHMIFNQRFSRDEYFAKVRELKKEFFENGGWFNAESRIMKKFDEVRFGLPHCENQQLRCENCVGDYNSNSNNCYAAFDSDDCEDGIYLWNCFGTKDSVDGLYVHGGQLCHDCMSIAVGFNVDSSFWMIGCRDCKYGYCMHQCEHCFGCTNLKHKKYHILNKEYSKDEYFKKTAEIIEELKRDGIYGKNLIYLAMKDVELGMPEAI